VALPPKFPSVEGSTSKTKSTSKARGKKRKADKPDNKITKKTKTKQPITTNSREKVHRNPAARWVRKQSTAVANPSPHDSSSEKKGRKRNVGNMVGDVLKSTFKTITLNVGTISSRLQRGLDKNFQSTEDDVADYIDATIQDLVKLNTDLIRSGILATFNYINVVMAKHPSIAENTIRREKLQYIADDQHSFFHTLVKGLYRWGQDLKGSGESFKAALEAIELYKDMPGDKNDFMERISGYLNGGMSRHFLEQIAQTLADMVRCHIRAFVSELRKRVSIMSHLLVRSKIGLHVNICTYVVFTIDIGDYLEPKLVIE
jgi:hypothetical protein